MENELLLELKLHTMCLSRQLAFYHLNYRFPYAIFYRSFGSPFGYRSFGAVICLLQSYSTFCLSVCQKVLVWWVSIYEVPILHATHSGQFEYTFSMSPIQTKL